MNLKQLRAAVALMEEFGEGNVRISSRGPIIVHCGPSPKQSYRYRFSLDENGNLLHGVGTNATVAFRDGEFV